VRKLEPIDENLSALAGRRTIAIDLHDLALPRQDGEQTALAPVPEYRLVDMRRLVAGVIAPIAMLQPSARGPP
jgi:hypothetical protein